MGHRLRKVLLYWRTARHLKPSQLFWRVRYRGRNGRARRYRVPQPLPRPYGRVRECLRDFATHWAAAAPPDSARTEAFIQGRFTFLNKTLRSSHPLWRGLDVPKLWAYNLHYFDYARDVALSNPDPTSPGAARVREWMEDWIAKNTDYEPIAWDAFPLSVRLMNWSLVMSVYGWEDFRLLESLHLQLDYLAKNLERDLRGNHLLKNAAALTVAGALVNSPHGKTGLALLKKEVGTQFLADGGHVERSTMYHGQALADLLLARAVLDPNPDWLAGATERGITFLQGLSHGDGLCAQFNDGAAEEGLSPMVVQALAKKYYWGAPAPGGSTAYAESGFYRLSPGREAGLMLVKAGNSTANHQPGHAHSDLLSFEYSLGAQRIFVNAGTHGYAKSPYRDYCRSTAAHNTVRINGQEQLEHWSTFRVARRVHGKIESWNAAAPALLATYQTIQGPRHSRTVAWDGRGWWRILDAVTGRGTLSVERFLHLHPDCTAEPFDAGAAVEVDHAYRITSGETALILLIAGADGVSVIRGSDSQPQGWYFPRFGEAVPATALVLETRGTDTVCTGIAILPGDADPVNAAADLDRAVAGIRSG